MNNAHIRQRKNVSNFPVLDKNSKNVKEERNFGKELKNINKNGILNKEFKNKQLKIKEKEEELTKQTKLSLADADQMNKSRSSIIKVMPQTINLVKKTNETGKNKNKQTGIQKSLTDKETVELDDLYNGNIQYVTEYIKDIFKHIIKTEVRNLIFYFIRMTSFLTQAIF